MVEPVFKRLALIGIGLIGSSIARGAKAFGGIAGEIVICDANSEALARAEALGLGDAYEADAARAVAGANGVILCAPVGSFAGLAAAIAPHLMPGAVLSDVGSTKQSVLRDVAPFVPEGVWFVPAHPIAGTEFSGPDAGLAELFQGRWCLLTPPAVTDEAALQK